MSARLKKYTYINSFNQKFTSRIILLIIDLEIDKNQSGSVNRNVCNSKFVTISNMIETFEKNSTAINLMK